MSERPFLTLNDLQSDTRPIVVSEGEIGRDHAMYGKLKQMAESRGVKLEILSDAEYALLTDPARQQSKEPEPGVRTLDDGSQVYTVSEGVIGSSAKAYQEHKERARALGLEFRVV